MTMKRSITKTSLRLAIFGLVFMISGCTRRIDRPTHLICIVDLTGSVETEAQAASFEAIHGTIQNLKRGDSLTIIPITGDAEIEGPARILRFRLSEKRQVYDADMRRLAKQVETRLQELLAAATTNPYPHSDILGALKLAAEEFANAPENGHKVLVCLSDFIQDDAQYNFKRDRRLADERAAREFAATLADATLKRFQTVHIYLGTVRSVDLRNLPKARREALRAFWTEFLTGQGATSVKYATDGPGQLTQFLVSAQEKSISSE